MRTMKDKPVTADLIGKIDGYLCKAIRWNYTVNLKLLSELAFVWCGSEIV